MKRWFVALLAISGLVPIMLLSGAFSTAGTGTQVPSARAGQLGIDDELTDEQERLLSGFAAFELGKTGNDNPGGDSAASTYFPRGSGDCPNNNSSIIKVNQNCLNLSDRDLQGRSQAQNETSIKVNPNNTNQIVASYNDYRRGDGTCGASWSTDSGRTWNDSTVPNGFVRGSAFNAAREYFEAGGDTSVDWDSKGNAYMACQLFQRGRPTTPNPDSSSAFYVFRSTQNGGASWNFTGRPVTLTNNTNGNFLPLEDKELLAVDHNATACATSTTAVTPGASCTPFQDRIYVTWTEFAPDGSAYIWESYSSDYGEHFSQRHLVSGDSALCPVTFGAGTPDGKCNENQFSQPFVGPDGTLYVAWSNFNNATVGTDNRNQILLAKSVDGGNTFTAPIKVTDYYDLPDCATYQQGHDFGRACVPEKNATARSIFRATNYASGVVNPTNPAQVIVTVGSYINQHSNEANGCTPAGLSPATGQNLFTGVKTPGACNNDILVSVSNDAGATFTGTTTDPRVMPVATTEAGQATTDQFWQWATFTKNGKLATSYYDRQYGNDEAVGNTDISLSSSGGPFAGPYQVVRVTNTPMPPPTQFPESNGYSAFFGDYSGVDADTQAHPFWSDSHDPDLFACPNSDNTGIALPPAVCGASLNDGTVLNDENVYSANVGISSK